MVITAKIKIIKIVLEKQNNLLVKSISLLRWNHGEENY